MKYYFIIIFLFCIFVLLLKKNRENFSNKIKQDGFNSFDKYMYINLKDRKDRKQQIELQLKKMNISKDKIIRIDAVKEKYNGHIGCCKSHIKALKLAQELNLNNVVILEDDFIFTKRKEEIDYKINHFIDNYKSFDVIMLTTHYKNLKNINDRHIMKVNNASTSSGYIIQSSFYNKLINNLEEALMKMENEMNEFNKKINGKKKYDTQYALDQHWNSLQKKSNWFIFYPYLGTQSDSKSSIMGKIENFIIYKPIIKIIQV